MHYLLKIPVYLSIFLIFISLNACSGGSQQGATEPSPVTSEKEHSKDDGHAHSDDELHSKDDGHAHKKDELHSKGGQVVESDPYHIELVTDSKGDSTQLGLYLFHEAEDRAIIDAQVTANIQLPNGEQKTLRLDYDPSIKKYNGNLSSQATGQYGIVIQSIISGEKINSRFNFER